MPGVDRIVELNARIGAGPCGMADLIPQFARRDGLGCLAIGAPDQLPGQIFTYRTQKGIRHPHRIVRILPRNRDISFRIPIRIVNRKLNGIEALPGILKNSVDIGFWNHHPLGIAQAALERIVLGGIGGILDAAIPRTDGGKDGIQLLLMHLRTRHQRGDLLFFDHLPVDELLDVGVIHVADHHLCRAPGRSARFDRSGCAVSDLQKAHEPRRFSAARQFLALPSKGRKIGARSRAVFEQPRFPDPQVHDAALVHQIVGDGLDKAGMGLGMFIGAGRPDQLARLVIDIEMALAGAVDAIGPMQAGIEPLRTVGRPHLGRQHMAHLVVIGACVFFVGKIPTFPAPIGPGPGHPVENLTGAGLAAKARVLGQMRQRLLVGDRAPQEFRYALFLDALEPHGHPGLAEIFLGNDVRGDLAPPLRHLDRLVAEDDLAVGITNLAGGGGKGKRAVSPALGRGEAPFDPHTLTVPRHPPGRASFNHPPRAIQAGSGGRMVRHPKAFPDLCRLPPDQITCRNDTISGGFAYLGHKLTRDREHFNQIFYWTLALAPSFAPPRDSLQLHC